MACRAKNNPLLGAEEHVDAPTGDYQLVPVLDVTEVPEHLSADYLVQVRLFNGDYVVIEVTEDRFEPGEEKILIKREEGQWIQVTAKELEKMLEPMIEDETDRDAASSYADYDGELPRKYQGAEVEDVYRVAMFGEYVYTGDRYNERESDRESWRKDIPKGAIELDEQYTEYESEFELEWVAEVLANQLGLGVGAAEYIEEAIAAENRGSRYLHGYTSGYVKTFIVLGKPFLDKGYVIAESVKGEYYPVVHDKKFLAAGATLDEALMHVYVDQDRQRNLKDLTAFIVYADGSAKQVELVSKRADKVKFEVIREWDRDLNLVVSE